MRHPALTRLSACTDAREGEVLELIAAGATNSAIAERLVIAEHTVKSHVKHILRKLGAANRPRSSRWRPAWMTVLTTGCGKRRLWRRMVSDRAH